MSISLAMLSTALKFTRIIAVFLVLPWIVVALAGCGSTTQRTATEQLLLSEAVDNAVNQIDFSPLAGQKVFLDVAALSPVEGQSIINGKYVASALRQKMLAAHCRLQEVRDDADLIVEARVGALATNGHEVIYGLPASNGISALASLGGGPVLPPIPELSAGRMNVLAGASKVAAFAYDRVTREPVWQSGTLRSETHARSTWILGAGPYVRGNIFDKPRFLEATVPDKQPTNSPVYDRVPLRERFVFQRDPAVSATLRTAEQPEIETGEPAEIR